MTNEEAYNIISEFCFTGYEDNKKPSAKLFNAIRELVCEVHENAELRDYKARLEKENDKLKFEIEQLKSELEQSVKSPCKVGDIVYAYSTYFGILACEINSIHICCGINFEAIASINDDMLDNFDFDIEDIGKTVFLTREEAEQSLKGQV